MAARITCINKSAGDHDNPHEAVEFYGWWEDSTGETGKAERLAMVEWVENGGVAYVLDSLGDKAYCYVNVSINGTKFLQTHRDGIPTDNLLSLPECI